MGMYIIYDSHYHTMVGILYSIVYTEQFHFSMFIVSIVNTWHVVGAS